MSSCAKQSVVLLAPFERPNFTSIDSIIGHCRTAAFCEHNRRVRVAVIAASTARPWRRPAPCASGGTGGFICYTSDRSTTNAYEWSRRCCAPATASQSTRCTSKVSAESLLTKRLRLMLYKLVSHTQLVHVNLIRRPHSKTARTHRGVPHIVSGCDLPQSAEHCESQTSCPLAVSAQSSFGAEC